MRHPTVSSVSKRADSSDDKWDVISGPEPKKKTCGSFAEADEHAQSLAMDLSITEIKIIERRVIFSWRRRD